METDDEYVLSDETMKLLKKRKRGCFVCDIILKDFERNKKLTGWPYDYSNQSAMPVDAKLTHLKLEKESTHGDQPEEGEKDRPDGGGGSPEKVPSDDRVGTS